MKIMPSCLLTPPSGYSFQPDLICQLCCHQRHPRAHRSGWTLDLHACFPSTQPSPSNPSSRSDYQPSQGTSSNSLKFITQLTCSHIFLSFACGQLRVTRSHFISKELCPVISCPKWPKGCFQVYHNRLTYLGFIFRFLPWLPLSVYFFQSYNNFEICLQIIKSHNINSFCFFSFSQCYRANLTLILTF